MPGPGQYVYARRSLPGSLPGSTMGQVRVVVTRIERDGTMHRRMVDSAQQSNPLNWEDLAARALATRPPYRPVPGTAVYHLCVNGDIIQVGEYDLQGPLRDLVTVLAIGSTMLPAPGGRPRGGLVVHTIPTGGPTRPPMIRNTCGLTFAAGASHPGPRSGRRPSEPCPCPPRARCSGRPHALAVTHHITGHRPTRLPRGYYLPGDVLRAAVRAGYAALRPRQKLS